MGGELRCCERVSSSYSTSGSRRVNLVTNPVICHIRGNDREVLTTSGTYPWSFVTQIFHNGQPRHGGDRKTFEEMTSTWPRGTLGSVASWLAAKLYQGNPDRNHKLWNIVSTERYILHMQVLLECCYILMEISQWENLNNLFCRKVSFLTAPHCQFRGVGHGMKQTYICICGILYIKLNTRNQSFIVTREIIHTIYKSFYQLWCQNVAILKVPHQGESFEHHNSTLTIWTKKYSEKKRRIACHFDLLSFSIYIPIGLKKWRILEMLWINPELSILIQFNSKFYLKSIHSIYI